MDDAKRFMDGTDVKRAPYRVPDEWGNCDGVSVCELGPVWRESNKYSKLIYFDYKPTTEMSCWLALTGSAGFYAYLSENTLLHALFPFW